jgi:hypothetical protein
MEHAITSAHSPVPHSPSATILMLPQWEHTPYRHSKYINSPYTHHLYTLPNDANTFITPYQHTGNPTPTLFGTRWMVDIYLIAKPLALSALHSHTTMTALHNTLESIYNTHLPNPTITKLKLKLFTTIPVRTGCRLWAPPFAMPYRT